MALHDAQEPTDFLIPNEPPQEDLTESAKRLSMLHLDNVNHSPSPTSSNVAAGHLHHHHPCEREDQTRPSRFLAVSLSLSPKNLAAIHNTTSALPVLRRCFSDPYTVPSAVGAPSTPNPSPESSRLPPRPPSLKRCVSDPSSITTCQDSCLEDTEMGVDLSKEENSDLMTMRRLKDQLREMKKWLDEVMQEGKEHQVEEGDKAMSVSQVDEGHKAVSVSQMVNATSPYLPQEIIEDILKSLPMRRLIRFTCVCTHWNSLFRSQNFIQELLNQSKEKPFLLIQRSHEDIPLHICLVNCEMQFSGRQASLTSASLELTRTVGSCDGLLCLVDYKERPSTTLLFNRETRELIELPLQVIRHSEIFYSFIKDSKFGFGYSHVTDDYKILRIVGNESPDMARIFSLTWWTWRGVNCDLIRAFKINDHCVSVNGVLYCFGSPPGTRKIKGINGAGAIISFNLATEVFSVTPLPRSSINSRVIQLAAIGDKLGIITSDITEDPGQHALYIGLMDECVKRWSARQYIGTFNASMSYLRTVWNNQVVSVPVNQSAADGIYLFDLNTHETRTLDFPSFGFPTDGNRSCHFVGNFTPSLVRIRQRIKRRLY